MPRARTSTPSTRQTAASPQGSGCLSGFLIPPLAVLLVSLLLVFIAKGANPTVQAETLPSPALTSAAGLPTSISPIFRPEIQYWADSIIRWAAASDLDPNLVAVVMQIESCGDPRATSSAGAMGLFQVMPYHFASGENPYSPDTNALRGMGYLKRSLDAAGGNARLALAGYNGGIGVIARGEWTWAAETVRYVKYGYPLYQDAVRGALSSDTLNEWYRGYGASLCRQAASRLGLP